jgi:hypothetical protein
MATRRWFPASRVVQNTLITKTTAFMADGNNRNNIGFASNTPSGIWYDTTYAPKLMRYNTVYQLWQNPVTSTKPVLDDLKDAESEFFSLYRVFYATVKASPLVTNAYLEDMGFPPRPSGGRSPHPVDKLFIDLNVMPMGNLIIKAAFENRDTGSSVIPEYLTGAVVYYLVSDTPVTDQNSLAFSKLATRSPLELTFEPAQRGKMVYLAARWQNRRGELGPWSEIVSCVIP